MPFSVGSPHLPSLELESYGLEWAFPEVQYSHPLEDGRGAAALRDLGDTAEVMSHDGTDLSSVDATVAFWVRVSRWEDGFERALLEAVLRWLRDDWSLERRVIMTNEKLDHQIETIESLGLTRRFD